MEILLEADVTGPSVLCFFLPYNNNSNVHDTNFLQAFNCMRIYLVKEKIERFLH